MIPSPSQLSVYSSFVLSTITLPVPSEQIHEYIETAYEYVESFNTSATAEYQGFSGKVVPYPQLLPSYQGDILAVSLTPDGTQVAVAGNKREISIYNLPRLTQLQLALRRATHETKPIEALYEPVRLKGHRDLIRWIYLDSSGETCFSAGNDGALYQWDVPSASIQDTVALQNCPILTAAYHPRWKVLAFYNCRQDRTNQPSYALHIHQLNPLNEVLEVPDRQIEEQVIWCLTWGHQHSYLAYGNDQGDVMIYDAIEQRVIANPILSDGAAVGFMTFTEDDSFFIVGDTHGKIGIYETLSSWKEWGTLYTQLNQEIWTGTLLLQDAYLVIGGDRGLEVFRWKTKEQTDQLEIGSVEALDASPNQPGLFVCDDAMYPGKGMIWRMARGRQIPGRSAQSRHLRNSSYFPSSTIPVEERRNQNP